MVSRCVSKIEEYHCSAASTICRVPAETGGVEAMPEAAQDEAHPAETETEREREKRSGRLQLYGAEKTFEHETKKKNRICI